MRDGKTEYEIMEEKLSELRAKANSVRYATSTRKKAKRQITAIKAAIKLWPPYEDRIEPEQRPFESYLIDTGYKTQDAELQSKYLVFDIETNGLRKSNDDLLSLSIYDPTTGLCYNRFLPLDLQPCVLTGYIHGIKAEDLDRVAHLTQEEIDWLYRTFDMKHRILLSFSGGQGLFDEVFVQNYCLRHSLMGFFDLDFKNIKSIFPKVPFGMSGNLTKDNLCQMMGIAGVSEMHTSCNDCLLEWKLFEKLGNQRVFFIGNKLYRYSPSYIIPVSYLVRCPVLTDFAGIKIPSINGVPTEVFRLEIPKKLVRKIRKFPTNITGMALEHGINSALRAQEQDNQRFLAENKSHLECLGTLPDTIKQIFVIPESDGTLTAWDEEDSPLISDVNESTKLIVQACEPLFGYMRQNVFQNGGVISQELVLSEDKKVLALCDLSNVDSVVEIKTFNVLNSSGMVASRVATQLFYESRGRAAYLLAITFEEEKEERLSETSIKNILLQLFKVEIQQYEPAKEIRTFRLDALDKSILAAIQQNGPIISKSEIAQKIGMPIKYVDSSLDDLIAFGYIKEMSMGETASRWEILRDPANDLLEYRNAGGIIVLENE